MAGTAGAADFTPRRVYLRDGTPAIVRAIRPDGGPRLAQALRDLSPASRYQRFLCFKDDFSDAELDYLTTCDGVNHMALVLAITNPEGEELFPVAVARTVRDTADSTLAEVAVVVADAWHRRGVATLLLTSLAQHSLAAGITRWRATLLASNRSALRLLEHAGRRLSARPAGNGVVDVVYELALPE